MGKVKIILWIMTLICFMPFSRVEAESEMDELDMMYECGEVKISDMLKSDLTIFDSLEGVEQYMRSSLPEWAVSIVTSSSEAAINKHLKGKITIDSINEARDYFIDRLRIALIDKANKDGADVGDCQMEIAAIMESLSQNKIYNLFNENFHRAFVENNIPLRFRTTDNYIEVLMMTSLPKLKAGSGVCKTYQQKGARNELKVTICN